jgi:hypothetical protein
MNEGTSNVENHRRMGFYEGPITTRMEEEGEVPRSRDEAPSYGRAQYSSQDTPDLRAMALDKLLSEREKIIDAIGIAELSPKQKLSLLEDNRQSMLILRGGNPYKFGTEKVIYSILIFSAFVIIVLSALTAFAGLAKEVTITFVGTVVGGTIATIAQKLGKIGS